MSGAAVMAKNMETGETRSTVTDEMGDYWVPSLAVGEYEVHVTKQGFQEQVRGGIHLVVGQEASRKRGAKARADQRSIQSYRRRSSQSA